MTTQPKYKELLETVRKTFDERREPHGDAKSNFEQKAKRWSFDA